MYYLVIPRDLLLFFLNLPLFPICLSLWLQKKCGEGMGSPHHLKLFPLLRDKIPPRNLSLICHPCSQHYLGEKYFASRGGSRDGETDTQCYSWNEQPLLFAPSLALEMSREKRFASGDSGDWYENEGEEDRATNPTETELFLRNALNTNPFSFCANVWTKIFG